MRSDGDDGDDDDDDDDDEFEGASGSEDIGASDRSDISGTEAPVVVVDDSQSRIGLASAGSRHDWKDFMSSKISKVSGRAPQTRKPSKAELEQDRQDEEHDRELNDLLKTSKLIESYS
nr:hypothetical protein HK105_002229 [Polyrhizophydium stewartii]